VLRKDEGGAVFSLASGSDDDIDDGADGVDHAVFFGGVGGVAEVGDTACY